MRINPYLVRPQGPWNMGDSTQHFHFHTQTLFFSLSLPQVMMCKTNLRIFPSLWWDLGAL